MANPVVKVHTGVRIPGAKYLERHINAHGRYTYRYKPRKLRLLRHHEVLHGEIMHDHDWQHPAKPQEQQQAPTGATNSTSQPDNWVVSRVDLRAFKRAVLDRRSWSIKRKHYDLWYDPAYARIHVPDNDLEQYARDCLTLVENGVDFIWWKHA